MEYGMIWTQARAVLAELLYRRICHAPVPRSFAHRIRMLRVLYRLSNAVVRNYYVCSLQMRLREVSPRKSGVESTILAKCPRPFQLLETSSKYACTGPAVEDHTGDGSILETRGLTLEKSSSAILSVSKEIFVVPFLGPRGWAVVNAGFRAYANLSRKVQMIAAMSW